MHLPRTVLRTLVLILGLALPAAAGRPELQPPPPSLIAQELLPPRALASFLDALKALERWTGRELPDWIVHTGTLRYQARKPLYDADGRPLVGADGRQACAQVELTGRVFYPPAWRLGSRRDLPLVLYAHATMMRKDAVSSRFGGEEWMLAAAAALYYGFAVAMPDQPGMGAGPGYHPFCHAKSLAYGNLDAIPAFREQFSEDPVLASAGLRWDGSLFLMGYSEGAYAAMAAVKELEEHAEEYRAKGLVLTASACMAGPFDLSGIARTDIINPLRPFAHCFYLPYVILGYHGVYGRILDPQEVFAPALLETRADGNLLQWADGSMDGLVVQLRIAERLRVDPARVVLRDLLNPAWVARELDDPGYASSRVRQLLLENDLHRGWTPTRPILFCHSRTDEDIPYQDTLAAMANLGGAILKAGGDPGRLLVQKPLGVAGLPISHVAGALLAIPTAFDWIHGQLR